MQAFPKTLREIIKDLQRIEISYRAENECYQRYGHPCYVTNKNRDTQYQHFLSTFHEDRGEIWYNKILTYLTLT